MQDSSGDRHLIVKELQRVRSENQAELNRLHLTFLDEKIESSYGTWMVPALTGGAEVDAADINDMLRKVRRELEKAAKLPVTVILDIEEN